MTYWRLVDWSWLWILAACCAFAGAQEAFERVGMEQVPGQAYQSFQLLLKGDVPPPERLALRGRLAVLPGVANVEWLGPREVLQRILREELSEEQVALLQDQVPQVVELQVPTQALLERRFDPKVLGTFPQVERYDWDEWAVASALEEQERWRLRSRQLQLGFLLASVILVGAGFLLTSRRNQLRMACEQAGGIGEWGTAASAVSEIYLAGSAAWLRVMGIQALAGLVLAFGLFVFFSELFVYSYTAPLPSLVATTDWRFLWAAGCLAAIGKGLDLFRVRLHYERARQALERQGSPAA